MLEYEHPTRGAVAVQTPLSKPLSPSDIKKQIESSTPAVREGARMCEHPNEGDSQIPSGEGPVETPTRS